MYKLMIVDDDEVIRSQLKKTIPFEKLELTLCGEAADGEEALELFNQLRPQIVITDINIPLLSGLDFAREVLRISKDVGVIIITGYGTLDFAREAIKTGTSDFLLKPIEASEMERALVQVIGRLNANAAVYRERQQMEHLFQESLPLLRERYLSGLLSNMVHADEDNCRAHLKRLRMDLCGRWLCVAILIPNYFEVPEGDRELMQIAIENIITEIVGEAGVSCHLFYDALSRAIVLATSDSSNINTLLEKQLSVARDKLRFYFQYDFFAGIGQTVEAITALPTSYSSADRALGFKSIFGENNIVNIVNVIQPEMPKGTALRSEQNAIVKLMIDTNQEELFRTMQHYFNRVISASGGSETFAKQLYIELLVKLLSCAGEAGLDIQAVCSSDPYKEIMLSTGLYRAQKQVTELAESLLRQICDKRSNRNCRLIEQAKRHIAEHLSDPDLNLTSVSVSIGLSSVYFCSLFKKELGCNFTDYLNQVRIEQAKHLLATTNMRVYEVSSAVGYSSPKYFFQVFKRLTNKRPREFSESNG